MLTSTGNIPYILFIYLFISLNVTPPTEKGPQGEETAAPLRRSRCKKNWKVITLDSLKMVYCVTNLLLRRISIS
jgi:hypothetical protein